MVVNFQDALTLLGHRYLGLTGFWLRAELLVSFYYHEDACWPIWSIPKRALIPSSPAYWFMSLVIESL